MLILVVSSGQRPVLPDVFWFGARSLVFSSVAPQWHVCRRKVRWRSSFPAELGPFRSQGRGRPCLSIGTRATGSLLHGYLMQTKWCKKWHFFTPFISFYSVGVKNGTFLHQILDSANTPAIRQYMLCKPKRRKSCTHANKAIDIREEILDLITSMSRSARESELRLRIAKHLCGRVRPSRAHPCSLFRPLIGTKSH